MFDKYPKLRETLTRGLKDRRAELNVHGTPHSSPSKEVADSNTPGKPLDFQIDISGSEWAAQNQPPAEHKMFDSTVADLFNTDILTSPSKRKKVVNSRKHQELIKKLDIENLYRTIGLSTFPVVDPSDVEQDEDGETIFRRSMIGLRLEIFNELDKTFEPPHYVLFKQNLKTGHWNIFRHTIPSYVGVERLFEQTKTINPLADIGKIYTFGKKVYTSLLSISTKQQTFKSLAESGIVSQLVIDPSCTSASFQMMQGSVSVKLKLSETDITACSSIPRSSQKWTATILGPVQSLPRRLQTLV